MLDRENLENINFGKDLILDCIDHIKSNYNFSEELNNQVLALENGYLALNSLENKMANFSETQDSNVDLETPAIETAMGIANYYMKKDGKTIEEIRVADEKEDDANFLRNDSNLAANITDEDKMAVAFSTNVRSFVDEFIPLLNNFVGFSTNGSTLIERAPTMAESKVKMDGIVQAMKSGAKLSWFGGNSNKSKSYIERLRDELYHYLMVKKACEVALECLKEKLPYVAYQAYVSANNVYYFGEDDYHTAIITKVKKNVEERIKELKDEIREAAKELNFSDTIPTMVLTNKAGNVYSLTHQDFSDIAEYAIENAGTHFSDYNDYYNKAFDLFTFSLSYVLKYLDNEDSIAYQFSNKNKVNEDDEEKKLISDNTKSNIKHAAIGAGVGALLKGGYTAFKKSKDYDAYYENELSHGRTPMSKAKWLLANKDVQMSALVGGGLGAAGGLGYKYAKDKYWNGGDDDGDSSGGSGSGSGKDGSNGPASNMYSQAFEKLSKFTRDLKVLKEHEIASSARHFEQKLENMVRNDKLLKKVFDGTNFKADEFLKKANVGSMKDPKTRDAVVNNIKNYISKLGNYKSEDYNTNLSAIEEGMMSGQLAPVRKALNIDNKNSNISKLVGQLLNSKGDAAKDLLEDIKKEVSMTSDPREAVLGATASIFNIKRIISQAPKGNKVLPIKTIDNLRDVTILFDYCMDKIGVKSDTKSFLKGSKGADKINSFISDLRKLQGIVSKKNQIAVIDATFVKRYDSVNDFMNDFDKINSSAIIEVPNGKGGINKVKKPELKITGGEVSNYLFGSDGNGGKIASAVKQVQKKLASNHAGAIRSKVKQFFFSQYGYYPEDNDKRFKYMCFSMVSKGVIEVEALEVFNFDSNVSKKKTLSLTLV